MDPEIGTKLLVPASLSLSETQYRIHNHCLESLPNGQEQEEQKQCQTTLDILHAE